MVEQPVKRWEHYKAAEQFLESVTELVEDDSSTMSLTEKRWWIAIHLDAAQTHATLALVSAEVEESARRGE